MFFLFKHHDTSGSRGLSSGLLFNGILCVLFGLAILAAPDLLAYIVALFLLVLGASLLAAWWRVK